MILRQTGSSRMSVRKLPPEWWLGEGRSPEERALEVPRVCEGRSQERGARPHRGAGERGVRQRGQGRREHHWGGTHRPPSGSRTSAGNKLPPFATIHKNGRKADPDSNSCCAEDGGGRGGDRLLLVFSLPKKNWAVLFCGGVTE